MFCTRITKIKSKIFNIFLNSLLFDQSKNNLRLKTECSVDEQNEKKSCYHAIFDETLPTR